MRQSGMRFVLQAARTGVWLWMTCAKGIKAVQIGPRTTTGQPVVNAEKRYFEPDPPLALRPVRDGTATSHQAMSFAGGTASEHAECSGLYLSAVAGGSAAADAAQTILLGVTDAWGNRGGVARRCVTTGTVILSTGNLEQLGKRIGGERQHDGISVAVDGPNED
jgi:hypothetical protein